MIPTVSHEFVCFPASWAPARFAGIIFLFLQIIRDPGSWKRVGYVCMGDILLIPEKEPLPLDLRTGKESAGLFAEIGFGNGEFLAHLAATHPENLYIGMEMSRACVLRAMKRLKPAPAGNVRLLCGDARFILGECMPPLSLDGVYMNFPCPWPKKKHARRRVTSGGFAVELAAVLKDGGFFELVTDEEWYAEEVRDILAAGPGFEVGEFSVNPPRQVTTKYERRWMELGKAIYLARLVKRGRGRSREHPYPGRAEDVHVLVGGTGPLDVPLKGLCGQGGKSGGTVWVFRNAYSSGDGVHLVETVATDDSFEQKFFLQVVERMSDRLVKISPSSAPFLTPSVKMAMADLAARLRREEGRPSVFPAGE